MNRKDVFFRRSWSPYHSQINIIIWWQTFIYHLKIIDWFNGFIYDWFYLKKKLKKKEKSLAAEHEEFCTMTSLSTGGGHKHFCIKYGLHKMSEGEKNYWNYCYYNKLFI